PLLHDADAEVQRTCEMVLISRGLDEKHIPVARAISHPAPTGRLAVFQLLRRSADLDRAVWLRRLSQDPAAAVRAAAVRAVIQQQQFDLRDRLAEMAEPDPSPTVRDLAVHYLGRAKRAMSNE